MAILIEREKQKSNWFAIVFIGAFVLVAGIAIYYLFFINPSLIENIAPSPRLQMLQNIDQIKNSANPNDIIESSAFKNLQNPIQPIIPEPAGNNEPFRKIL